MRVIFLMIASLILMCWADWPVIWDGGGEDHLTGLAVDLDGNVIAGGWNYVSNSGWWHIRKYDPNGNLLWNQDFHYLGDILHGIATDLTGNIIAGGYGSTGGWESEWEIIKYNSNGEQLWYNAYYHYPDLIEDMVAIVSGIWSEYHIGVGWIYTPPISARILKIDSSGGIIWDKIVDPGSNSVYYDVDIYPSTGEIIATGSLPSRGGGGLIKYDTNGNEIFTKIYPDSLPDSSMCSAVVVARQEFGFFALYYNYSSYTKILLAHYDNTGNLVWNKPISSHPLIGGDMTCDLSNNIWIPLGGYILKYDTLGNQLDSIDAPFGMNAIVCRPDTFGNIFVAGTVNNDWIIDRIEPTGIQEKMPIHKKSSNRFGLLNNPISGAYLKIYYSLEYPQNIACSVYNLTGQRVIELSTGSQTEGQHIITVNVSDLPAGVYFVRFEAGAFKQTEKAILLR